MHTSRSSYIYVMGLLCFIVFLTSGHSLDAAESGGGPNSNSAGTVVTGKDGAPMVLIPEGEFVMGTEDVGSNWYQGNPNEFPEHVVKLKSYYIDQFEVTIGRYAKFLEATDHAPPPSWDEEAVTTAADRPVVGVDWEDANAYCRWAGKRLPTEAEWEKAARGTDKRRFPWGDMQPFVDIANYNRGLWVSYPITLVPVTSGLEGMSIRHGLKEGGKSPYGLFHMAGNAAEWVADWYDREYYAKSSKEDPKGPESGEKKVIRGGSWGDPPRSLRVTARFSAHPDFRDTTIGFRCAMDAK
ncbi:formylglycine-generating enzyme family protein [Candidatus Nitrospira bockiana]